MSTSMSKNGSSEFYSLKQAAWILGISEADIRRAIQKGAIRATRRRNRLVVPASALQRMLGGAT